MEEDGHNDGLLDDDEALDYILYRELEREGQNTQGGSGCFGSLVVLLLLPISGVYLILKAFSSF